jgi:hypothetical protein
MVNTSGVPGQLPFKGVTVTVATCGVLPVFTPVKELIFPLPPEAKPIEVLLLVHV